jgi:hypothetical protein
MGVDPDLQDTLFKIRVRLLTELQHKLRQDTMVKANKFKSKLGAYLALSWPLDRQLRWL